MTFRRHFGMVVGGASQRERVWAEQGAFESAAPQWEERLDERERSGWSVTPNALRGRFSPCKRQFSSN
ncbi:unnamed protein product [Toxocara canis]|uniref:Uncharacterized protein n=1 Tax=Toxocara canis TaxID=6265 RepID=A0A183VCX9_TOXCA|nr:unnamed protein product [Toxocara canis]